MIVEHYPDRNGGTGGPGHNIHLHQLGGAYCDCKAAMFNKKCWALKAYIQLHNIPSANQKATDDAMTIARREAYERRKAIA